MSITTYSGGQENFIFKTENLDIDHKNIGGFYGSAISDFLLQSIGLVSFLFVLNLFFWGFKIIINKKINNFITKIFYTLLYIIFSAERPPNSTPILLKISSLTISFLFVAFC